MSTPKLVHLAARCQVDEYPDLSYLGEYSNTWKEDAIDRKETGDWVRGELRYFIPTQAECAKEDYSRMESFNRGDWCMLYVYVEAEFQTELGTATKSDTYHKLSTIRSGGICGIESDSTKEFLWDEILEMEFQQIREELDALRVDCSLWDELRSECTAIVDECGHRNFEL